jgi:multidrug efflux pump
MNELNQIKNTDQKYLDKLEFNPELRKGWLNFFVSNFRVVMLIIGLLLIAGVYSFSKLPRESEPEVKIPIAVITTTYPGASPSDVEELVTKKIETSISGIKGIDKITSNSSNSYSAVQINFNPKEDLDDSIRRVKDKVSNIKNKLPDDANDPIVTEISLQDQPIWTIAITGPYSGFAMSEYADDIKDELEKIPGVREVSISGEDQREFEVAYDPQKLLYYNLSSDQANSAISSNNIGIPSGNFDGQSFVYPIRTNAKVYTVEEIENIPVSHTDNGGIVYIKDLATVKEKTIKKSTISRLSIGGTDSHESINLSLVKRTGSSIIDTVDAAKKAVDEKIKTMPAGIKYDVTLNTANDVKENFDQLSHDFLLTLVLVFGILLAIVGLKEAVVASLAIPLVFFVTFLCLFLTGDSLNFLTLFSLILSLGLLVDDAIVVVSATKQYLKTGKFTPEEAVLLVLNDFKVVLTTTTLTTVWAFLPLLFCSGIMGEYIKSIPITVSITLISSLMVALMITHPLAAVLERIRLNKTMFFLVEFLIFVSAIIAFFSNSLIGYGIGAVLIAIEILAIRWYEKGGKETLVKNAELTEMESNDDDLIKKKLREQGSHENTNLSERLMHGILNLDKLLPIYEKYLRKITATKKTRLTTLAVVFSIFIFAVALPATGVVKSVFFPASDTDYVYIDIRNPVGQRIEETNKTAMQIEEKLLAYKEISNFSTIVGRASPLSYSGKSQSNIASVTITLKDEKLRKIKSYDLAEKMRQDIGNIKGSVITISTPSGGPPSGSAFEAQIKGDDLNELKRIVQELEPQLSSIPGVINTNISLKDASPEYTFTLDPVKMEQNYLNAAYVGSTLRMAISGTEVSTVIKDNKEIKIIAKFGEKDIPTLEDVQNLQILNLRKEPVFLKDISKIELKPSVDTITRIDQKRTIILSSGANASTSSTQVLAEFEKKIKDYNFPSGYSISYGGENEENTESVTSILLAMIIAIVLIISTMVVQFNSFRKTFIIITTIPLALIGTFIGMAIFNVPLSFPGLIGILALFGIVVKNAIILVDKININIKSGIPFEESIIDAGKSRLEAIFITSICTICGLIPITLSNEMWQSLGGAVIFGLMLSSFFTLFIVPTLYMTIIKEKDRF